MMLVPAWERAWSLFCCLQGLKGISIPPLKEDIFLINFLRLGTLAAMQLGPPRRAVQAECAQVFLSPGISRPLGLRP